MEVEASLHDKRPTKKTKNLGTIDSQPKCQNRFYMMKKRISRLKQMISFSMYRGTFLLGGMLPNNGRILMAANIFLYLIDQTGPLKIFKTKIKAQNLQKALRAARVGRALVHE